MVIGRTHVPLLTLKPLNNNIVELTQAGSIKILKDMKCLISCQLIVWNSPVLSDEWDINIYKIKNGVETLIGKAYSSIQSTHGLLTFNVSPFYCELEKDDIIFLAFLTFDSVQYYILGDDRTTYLTIQEL